ncbi:MAG: AAA family ATPase [Proteobacteria bacterium]|nr:AAA family ATPase [Pseudomonadota bacterium]
MNYKINSVEIKNFGIFKNKSINLSGFNIFFGKNESGKTTVLDAILTSLFKYPDKLFVNRKYKKKEVKIKLDNGKDIMELTPKSSEFIDDLGLFGKFSQKDYMIFRTLVMRGLSYSIEDDNHANKVFDLIKKNISGFDYTKLRNKIFELVQITPKTRDFKKDRKENIKNFKGKLSNIEMIKGELLELNEKQKGKPELESNVGQLNKLNNITNKLLSYIDYKEHKIQEDRVNGIEKELQSYSFLSDNDLFSWEQIVKSSYDLDKQLTQIKNEISMQKFQSEDLRNSIKETSVEIKKLSDELAKYEDFSENKDLYDNLSENLNKNSIIFNISLVVTSLMAITSVIFLLKHSFIPSIITIFPIGYTLFLFFKNKSTDDKKTDILELAEKNGISVSLYKDNIKKLNRSLEDLKSKLEQLNNEFDKTESEIEKNKKSVANITEKIKNNDNEVVKLISATHCKSVSELREKLNKKNELTINLKNEKSILERLGSPEITDVKLPQLKNMLSIIELNDNYEILRKNLHSHISSIEKAGNLKQLEDIAGELQSFNKTLTEKNDKNKSALNDIIKLEDGIKLLLNANKFKNRLEMELKEMEINSTLSLYENAKAAANLAINAIDSTEKEFTENIGNAINLEKIQDYMRIITGKKDLIVKIDGKMEFSVLENDEEINEAYLSTGTLVQLMFCIRIAIAEKLFNDQKLFFFLDDTFLTFDDERKLNAIKLVKKLYDDGWQIFYFTIDSEIIKLFSKEIKKIKQISM